MSLNKEKAIDYLKWIRPKNPYTQDKKNVQIAIDMAIEALKEQRPHGEWIPCKDDNFCKCSRCGIIVMSEEAEDFGYCPKCGSDNRKREGDEK